MLCFAVYAIAVCFGMFVLMYSRWWERVYKNVCKLHMIEKMYVCCDALYIGFRLCECLHEHIWMRASDRTTRGFCLCDYPVYAKRIYAMHFIVACLGVCLCDFTYVPGVWLCGFAKSFWIYIELVYVCVTSPGVCLCDFTCLVWHF